MRTEPEAARTSGRTRLAGLDFDGLTEAQTVRHIIGASHRGEGGWVATPNVDICRQARRYPGLRVVGADSPPLGFDTDPRAIEGVRDRVAAAAPDIVYVGLGFPKQERLIASLAPACPRAWFIGCGAAIPYAAKALPRPPAWMRRAGLAWLFRLLHEPRRLFRRYLVHDLPFAIRLLTSAAAGRFNRATRG